MNSVLITGGSGTFGRAFIGAALDAGVERVCVYSRGEHRQAEVRALYPDDERLRFFIGDVRDRKRLERAMQRVEVVVHAAALKRVEVGEYDATELVKTNVVGAMNVIEAAADAGVRKVLGISTDKACEPLNAYGASKLVMEKLLLAANNARGVDGPLFAVCRFGNIWGSAGSVVPLWRELSARGVTEVPVTDSLCTRFFMRQEEVSVFVLDAVSKMRGGEIFTPDLPAYRLGDLAAAMGVKMRKIGLPEFEKRHESMRRWVSSSHARRMSVEELRDELRRMP